MRYSTEPEDTCFGINLGKRRGPKEESLYAENERLQAENEARDMRIATLEAENERLRQELMQLRANLADFEPGKTYCAFCGESFPVEPDNALERVQEHIVVCKDHPMRVAESALAEVQRDCDAYKANSEESLDAIDLWRLEKAKLESALQNLLAIVHRDGGQHTSDVGLTQSVADAHETWANLIAQAEEAANLRSALAEARAALENIEAAAKVPMAAPRDQLAEAVVECYLSARAALANTETAGK